MDVLSVTATRALASLVSFERERFNGPTSPSIYTRPSSTVRAQSDPFSENRSSETARRV